jgi:hypothetical protein
MTGSSWIDWAAKAGCHAELQTLQVRSGTRPYPYGNGLRRQPMAVGVPARSLRLERNP